MNKILKISYKNMYVMITNVDIVHVLSKMPIKARENYYRKQKVFFASYNY